MIRQRPRPRSFVIIFDGGMSHALVVGGRVVKVEARGERPAYKNDGLAQAMWSGTTVSARGARVGMWG